MPRPQRDLNVDAFLISTGVVAVAEIGDKTQLLAILLAARFRKPLPILLGILVATLLNHGLAAGVGVLIAGWLSGVWFQIAVGVDVLLVSAGTTLGMMLANAPAVFFGEAAAKIVPLKYVRAGAAVLFLLIGVWVLAAALLRPVSGI